MEGESAPRFNRLVGRQLLNDHHTHRVPVLFSTNERRPYIYLYEEFTDSARYFGSLHSAAWELASTACKGGRRPERPDRVTPSLPLVSRTTVLRETIQTKG